MWLVVSEVPLARYGPTALERTLRDIDRVGRLAVAHESLVEYFARMSGATVVPMKMFTMFSSVDRAVSEMRARRMEIQAVLDRVVGCEEWGVRVGVRPRRLARSPEQPRSGTEFLTVRKRMRDEVRASAQRADDAAAAVFEELSHLAKEARKRQETPAGAVPPLLDAAFLVPVRSRTRFRAATTRLSRTCSDAGANLTLTGPWPAYNFVQMPVD
jgi:hypothetical protein